jgi:hypothetical protein
MTTTAPNTKNAKAARRRYLLGMRSDLASIVFALPRGSAERIDTERQLEEIGAELRTLKA